VITTYSFESELHLAESHYYDHGLGDKRKFKGHWFSFFTFAHKSGGLNAVKEICTKLRAKGYCAEYVPAHQFANYSVGFFIVPWLAKGWKIYYRHKC